MSQRTKVVTFAICPLNLTPLKELRHKIYQFKQQELPRNWVKHTDARAELLSCTQNQLFLDISTGLLSFSPSQLLTRPNRKITHHVYVKRQTRICTAWPSFLFTCRLLLIISTPKLVISRNFSSIRIVLSCFYLLIFYFEKFSTWIWRLPFAV